MAARDLAALAALLSERAVKVTAQGERALAELLGIEPQILR